ncbi:MAG: sensor histidine kinase [Bacteroidota bacterium]|nr:sensor histidine kinase [Bacteroidota bacterium]
MKKFLITFCWLIAVGPCCFGQIQPRNPIGILHSEYKKAPTDTTRLRLLHAEGDYYFTGYINNQQNLKLLDTAFQRFDEALRISTKLRLDTGFGKYPSLAKLGELWILKGDTTQGMRIIRQVIGFYHNKRDLYKEAKTLHLYYKYMAHYDTTLAINGFHKLEAIYMRLGQNDAAIRAGYNCVMLNYYRDQALSEQICLQLIKEFRYKRSTKLCLVYSILSIIYRYQGNLNKSLQYTLDGVKWMEETQGAQAAMIAPDFYGELGLIYQDLGQTENSIYWYKKTIEGREKLRIDQRLIFRTAGFMIEGLIKLHKTKEGLDYLNALVKRKPPVSDLERSDIAQIKAYCYDDLKQYKLAEFYYKSVLRLDSNEMQGEILWRSKLDAAAFYVRQKKYVEAARLLKSQTNNDRPLSSSRDLSLLWFKIDSSQGRSIDAIRQYQLYKTLNDSIFNVAKNKQIVELQVKYASDQKESDIRSLKKDQLLQSEKFRQATTTRNMILGGVVMLFIVLGILYNSFRINKKSSREIDRKNAALNRLVGEKDDLLKEKEWLIKEVHHRVKNNLQIVMGLLQRQSSFINNKVALAAIQNSELRMNSIALIHQKLYQSEDLKLVDMVEYIDEMIVYLQDSFDLRSRITFEKEIEEIDLDISTAVPLGLILNETITNAIKYAFPTHEKGCITIVLRQTGEDSYYLQISDNGRGLPDDFDVTKADSMGFNLIRGLSKQLDGKAITKSGPGFSLTISFKA